MPDYQLYQGNWTGPEIDAAIGRASYISNNNLLVNSCFVGGGSQNNSGRLPINQRGQTSYSGSGYGVDRWKITNSNFGMELKSDCLRLKCLTLISSGNIIFGQFFPTANLPAGTYTISFLTKGNSGGHWYYSSNGTAGYNIGNPPLSGLSYRTFTATGTETQPYFYIWEQGAVASGDYVDIIAAKLESGTQQTLAHQENGVWVLNEIPDYQVELAKCQRYYYDATEFGDIVLNGVSGAAGGAVSFSLNTPVTMVGTPTVEVTASWLRGNGNAYAIGSVTTSNAIIRQNRIDSVASIASSGLPGTQLYSALFSKLIVKIE